VRACALLPIDTNMRPHRYGQPFPREVFASPPILRSEKSPSGTSAVIIMINKQSTVSQDELTQAMFGSLPMVRGPVG
jgi:hypothetical protein